MFIPKFVEIPPLTGEIIASLGIGTEGLADNATRPDGRTADLKTYASHRLLLAAV